jgi:hypothetical protein
MKYAVYILYSEKFQKHPTGLTFDIFSLAHQGKSIFIRLITGLGNFREYLNRQIGIERCQPYGSYSQG